MMLTSVWVSTWHVWKSMGMFPSKFLYFRLLDYFWCILRYLSMSRSNLRLLLFLMFSHVQFSATLPALFNSFEAERPLQWLCDIIHYKNYVVCAQRYKPGVKTIQFYMKSPSNLYKTHWNTIMIARNTNAKMIL